MAEGSGLENQEIEVIKAPIVEVQSPPVVENKEFPESSPEENSENALDKNKKPESQEDDPDVVEHVDRAKIDALVKKIGDFYDLPPLAIERGLKSDIYIVKNESFDKALTEEEISRLSDNEKTDETIREIEKHAKATGGISILEENGESLILIKEKGPFNNEHSELHDILHAMSVGKKGEYKGFKKQIAGKEFDETNNNLNEATTEILTLSLEYPNLKMVEIYDGIVSGEIDAGYKYDVLTLLNVLSYTEGRDEKSFIVKDLAKIYFHGYEGDGDAAKLLKTELRGRISPGLYESIEPLFKGELEGA